MTADSPIDVEAEADMKKMPVSYLKNQDEFKTQEKKRIWHIKEIMRQVWKR